MKEVIGHRTLICGGRDFLNGQLMYETLNTGPYVHTVIHGAANGADTLAHEWAMVYAHTVEIFRADWIREGKAAGPLRNARMLKFGRPDRVVAFWDGKSKGTKNMINLAEAANIPVQIVLYTPQTRLEPRTEVLSTSPISP